MIVFEIILVMLAAAVLLLGVARWQKLPYPVLLAISGAAVAAAQRRAHMKSHGTVRALAVDARWTLSQGRLDPQRART